MSRLALSALLLPMLLAAPARAGADRPKASLGAPAGDISAPPRRAQAPKRETRAQPTARATTPRADRVLWDHWYTVTVGKSIHYEYYNDRVELRKGRVVFLNKAWKLEEDYINEEQAGVFAVDNDELTPLFFNFHSNYRSTEIFIDGNVANGKELTVRVRRGNTESPLIKRGMPSRAFFSELFPVWLGRRLPSLKPGQAQSFISVLEDNVEVGFVPVNGMVRVEAPDDTARRTRTTRLTVEFQNLRSTWWVDPQGSPVRIEMPAQRAVVERVSKEKAQAFLK